MNKTIQSRIQHPVHTAATLTAKNPVLLKGEVVYESDTRKHKIGDGATAWNALSYVGGILRACFGLEHHTRREPPLRKRRGENDLERQSIDGRSHPVGNGLMSAADKKKLMSFQRKV